VAEKSYSWVLLAAETFYFPRLSSYRGIFSQIVLVHHKNVVSHFKVNESEPPEKKLRPEGFEACRACLGVLQESVMQPALDLVSAGGRF
jgi:hypothetical protein